MNQGRAFPLGEPFQMKRSFCWMIRTIWWRSRKNWARSVFPARRWHWDITTIPSRAFVQNPLNTRYMETIYRTGDLGYYNEKHELCFSSRKDFQIKHMGHRIELGEIEASIEQIQEIDRACCIFDDRKNKIIAFYRGPVERREIIEQIGKVLPPYMVPNVFCRVEEMPLTKNGKIDRGKLMEIYRGNM